MNNMASRIPLLCFFLAMWLGGCGEEKVYQWNLPPGFPEPVVPADNPMTEDKVELGRYLFYDTRLSANQSQSCASCHQQQFAFAEPRSTALGSSGEFHRRNTLTLTNVAYQSTLTWAHNGLTSIERQILIPMFGESPVELGLAGAERDVLQRFKDNPRYQEMFAQAFGHGEINWRNIVDALACFTRSLVSFNSPFDRYAYYREDDALSESALRGLDLFMSERLECRHCHGGFNFTEASSHVTSNLQPFHNIGLYYLSRSLPHAFDQGLFEISGREEDKGRFRTPTLRNIEYTAPYMHDGSIGTLEEVIQFYADGGRNVTEGEFKGDGRTHPNKDVFIKGFILTDAERRDLLAFLTSLSDSDFIDNEKFSNPFAQKK